MKKIILMLLLALSIVAFPGCSEADRADKDEITMQWKECGEVKVPYGKLHVYYDTETKVMYAWGGNSLTVLMYPDGTPMLYEED